MSAGSYNIKLIGVPVSGPDWLRALGLGVVPGLDAFIGICGCRCRVSGMLGQSVDISDLDIIMTRAFEKILMRTSGSHGGMLRLE